MVGRVLLDSTRVGSYEGIQLEFCTTGIYQANCYYLLVNGEGLLIDPGANYPLLSQWVAGRPVQQILATHCHSDHIESINEFRAACGAPVLIAAEDAAAAKDPVLNGAVDDGWNFAVSTVDRELHDGDVVSVGKLNFQVMLTPGHTPGSICLYEPDFGLLLSGDTLFQGSIGRTDFIRGNARDMVKSLARLKQLPDNVLVFPGHGPATTMEIEKRLNPYLR